MSMGLSAEDGGPPTILVIDDDEGVRVMARAALEEDGLRVLEAENGEDALEILERHEPSIVLLDLNLPCMSGVELCRRIRENESTEELPVIMVTSDDNVESVDRCFAAGATDFVTKPVKWRVLVRRVRFVLRARATLGKLSESKKQLAAAHRVARIGGWTLTRDRFELSEEAAHLLGTDAGSAFTLGELWRRPSVEDQPQLRSTWELAIRSGDDFSIDFPIVDPEERVLRFIGEAVGREGSFSGMVQDVTDQVAADKRIRRLAYFDPVTGLGNRSWLKERAEIIIQDSRQQERRAGLIFLDLDGFKTVNDTFGHSAGDQLLSEVATRLRMSIRASDAMTHERDESDDPMLYRFGGDEFIILVGELTEASDLAHIASRIQAELPRIITIDGFDFSVTASMGLALWPDDGEDLETLIRKADAAMYAAKDAGRNQFQFHVERENSATLERMALESELRQALLRDEITVHYQPQINFRTGKVVQVEALMRWIRKGKSSVPPAVFIPMAEEIGIVKEIGAFAFGQACRQLKQWRDAGHDTLRMAINLSPNQLEQELAERVTRETAACGLPTDAIEFELTETALVRDKTQSTDVIRSLRKQGFTIALDDFGTGYSSLRHLVDFPVDVIKIDREFVSQIENEDSASTTLVRSLIKMASELKVSVVAEGVETLSQASILREWGCDLLQGYYFAKPAAARDIDLDRWIRPDVRKSVL